MADLFDWLEYLKFATASSTSDDEAVEEPLRLHATVR